MKCDQGYAGEHTLCPKETSPFDSLSHSNSAASPNALPCEQVLHLLVLIAVTTDPVNASESPASRALSREREVKDATGHTTKVLYWDQCFLEDIEQLLQTNVNLKLFDYHGWTGDNRIKNRQIAGAYLANRLCGANNLVAFYGPSYQKRDIHFHFIGHSHGGNVINEITQQIDKLGEKWPKTWKVKSLVYLSTPFFNKIHQVKVGGAFHPEAEVFHAYNQYDLTQRMLADFSMEPLYGAIRQITNMTMGEGSEKTAFEQALQDLLDAVGAIPFGHLGEVQWEERQLFPPKPPTPVLDRMSRQNGLALYDQTIMAFEKFIVLLQKSKEILKGLNTEYQYDVDRNIRDEQGNHLSHSRTMLPDPVYQAFASLLDTLIQDVEAVSERLSDIRKNTSGDFNKFAYIEALFESTDFFQHLAEFLDIDANTLQGNDLSLWNLLVGLLQHNIKDYDNTYADPAKQFAGTPLAGKTTPLEVTGRDRYHGSMGSTKFQTFIQDIETIETAYAADPSAYNLLDLLFTLIANEYSIYPHILNNADRVWWDTLETLTWGDVDTLIRQVRRVFENIVTIFRARHVGEMIQPAVWQGYSHNLNKKVGQWYARGDIHYLLVESHSTSRRCYIKNSSNFF